MAISFVGSKTFTHNATTAQSCSLTDLLNDAGGTASLAAGDYVVVNYVHAMATLGNRTLAQCTPSGYTAAHAAIIGNASESHSVSMAVSYKKMPATPDTTVSIPGANATTNGVAVVIHAFRDVDQTTPLDVTTTTASAINTGVANAPSITPTSSGAWIVACGGAAVAAGAVFTNPSGMSTTANHFRSVTITSTTNDANAGTALKTDWTSGAFDPAAFGGSTTTNTGSWGAATLALRPALTLISGTLSSTEADDTAAATATLKLVGSLSATEEGDALAATGGVTPVLGEAAITEGDDTLSSTAVITLSGVASITEAGDTVAAIGILPLVGTAAITEAGDTVSSAGALPVFGVVSLTEANDNVAAAGVLPIAGALAAAEEGDTLSAAGDLSSTGGEGSLSAAEESDGLSATGALRISGALAVNDNDDGITATGTLRIVGGLDYTEAGDTLSATLGSLLTTPLARTTASDRTARDFLAPVIENVTDAPSLPRTTFAAKRTA